MYMCVCVYHKACVVFIQRLKATFGCGAKKKNKFQGGKQHCHFHLLLHYSLS